MTSAKTETSTVTIDYRQPFGQMVAAGGYDHVNPQITEASFPPQPGDPAEHGLTLVHLGVVAARRA